MAARAAHRVVARQPWIEVELLAQLHLFRRHRVIRRYRHRLKAEWDFERIFIGGEGRGRSKYGSQQHSGSYSERAHTLTTLGVFKIGRIASLKAPAFWLTDRRA